MKINNQFRCSCGSKQLGYGGETIELPDSNSIFEFGEDATPMFLVYPLTCMNCGCVHLFSKKYLDEMKLSKIIL